VSFEAFAAEWLPNYAAAKGLKRSTRESYDTIIGRHLVPAFGRLRLEKIDARKVEEYVTGKRAAGFAPRSVNRQLNVLHAVFVAAIRQNLATRNPVGLVDRPPEPRRRWTILAPVEIVAVERALAELIDAAGDGRAWVEQSRVVFLTVLGAGLRRGEVLGLRWGSVNLADPQGASLRVCETLTRGALDTPKSEAGERTIALGPRLAEELWQHRRRSAFSGDDERVFCHPHKGTPLDHKRYATTLRLALARAGVDRPMRPFHDGRHTSITNSAAAGISPAALMARAGHADFATTQLYIDLSGERFRAEANLLEERLWGESGTKTRYQVPDSLPAVIVEDGI